MKKLIIFSCLNFLLNSLVFSDPVFHAQYLEKSKLLQWSGTIERKIHSDIEETFYPQFISEHQAPSEEKVVELFTRTEKTLLKILKKRGIKSSLVPSSNETLDEVVTLIDNGPSQNRIDLVFMGDGYTKVEKNKFFDDIQRLTNDLFEKDTFKSYLPLFNVHAVYRPSNESGIGKNNRPKDTAFKLYREGSTLRAIFPGNPSAALSACQKAPGCDYPIVVANDPYYGGLGGQLAITTSSPTSGTIVLRHELGHNFGRVGEEYDGGGYFGANFGNRLDQLTWNHWLTETPTREPSIAHFIGWPWQSLDKKSFSTTFKSSGQFETSEIVYSASGIETESDLVVKLDGNPFKAQSPHHSDRVFYTISLNTGFSSGEHTLSFEEGTHDGNNVLSNLTIHEYGKGYHFNNYTGAFPLYNLNNTFAGFRPTHDTCLMREMLSERFCSVCQENNWLKFFNTISLIDSVEINQKDDIVTVTVHTPHLGVLRKIPSSDKLEINWHKDRREVTTLGNFTQWSLSKEEAVGSWEVIVKWMSPEVRKDTDNLLLAKEKFEIKAS